MKSLLTNDKETTHVEDEASHQEEKKNETPEDLFYDDYIPENSKM